MDECIFCRIARGEIASSKIYEDDHTVAFLDINPIVKGHSLIIPKQHFETIFEMPPELFKTCCGVVQKVAKAVFKAMEAEGMNILQNNKAVAGQEISHLHFHVIPRFTNDGWDIPFPGKPYPPGDIDRVLTKIRNCL